MEINKFCKKCNKPISKHAIFCRSCSKKGIPLSDEHKAKLKEACKTRPKMSLDTREKIRISNTGKKRLKTYKGKDSPNYKGGRILSNGNCGGYILILSHDHPNRDSRNYVKEHRLVMEKHLGRYLNKNEIVHHINGIKTDNNINNLMLFPNISSHIKFNHLNTKTFICKHCGKSQL